MFRKIKRIKEIKHLNSQLKEARLNKVYQRSVQEHIISKQDAEEFHEERIVKEKKIVLKVMGEVVSVPDIDDMNEKLSLLREKENDLNMIVREKNQLEEKSHKDWQEGLSVMRKSQKSVDKFEYITDLEREKSEKHQQYLEDLELEEFKSIGNGNN